MFSLSTRLREVETTCGVNKVISLAEATDSEEENCGPLSVKSTSGTPNLANMHFSLAIKSVLRVFGKCAIFK